MMPNVPNVPGVPPLASYSAFSTVLMAVDTVLRSNIFFGPQWGLFVDGVPAFDFNSVVRFEYKKDFVISDYPLEKGAFQSYDKVALPGDIRLRIASDGTVAGRQIMLDALDDAAATLDLFDVVTPEKIYVGYNISHVDYDRQASKGVGMITVDIWLIEIRETSTATFTDTASPIAAGNQNIGVQQPRSFGQITVRPFTASQVR